MVKKTVKKLSNDSTELTSKKLTSDSLSSKEFVSVPSDSTKDLNTTEIVLSEEQEFAAIRESLLLQKSEILNKSSEFKATQSELQKSSDDADNTVQELHNAVSIQLHERDRKALFMIDRALSKFQEDTYGCCESCGDDIGIKRLKARPLATLCIACMEENEKSSKHNPLSLH